MRTMEMSAERLPRVMTFRNTLMVLAVTALLGGLPADVRQGRDGKHYSNRHHVRFVPRVRESGPAQTKSIDLYVSEDAGETWKKHSTHEDPEGVIVFEAPMDGHYAFSTVATDNLGQREPEPATKEEVELEVIIDTTAPKLALDRKLIDLKARSRDVKMLYWKAQDANPVDHVHIAWWDPSSRNWITKARLKDARSYAFQIPDVNWGWEHFKVRLQAHDAAGNASAPEEIIFELGPRVLGPVSSISAPQNSQDNEIELVMTQEGLNSTEFSHYEIFYTDDDGSSWARAGSTKSGRLTWQVPHDGTYGFFSQVVARDGTGEVAPRSGDRPKVTCLIDTKDPQLALEVPRSGERYSKDRPLAISWHGVENHPTDKPVTVWWSGDDGETWNWLTEAPLTGTHHWNLSGHAGSNFRIKLEARDKAGRRTTVLSERFSIGQMTSEEKVHYDALFRRANAMRVLGRWSDSIEAYQDVLKFNPHDPLALNDLGVVYTQLKKWDEAIDSFTRASGIEPANKEYLFNLGFALYYNDMPELAEDALLRLINLDETNARAHWYLAEIRLLRRDLDGSRRHLRRILEIDDPRNQLKPMARERLALYDK